MVTPSHLRCSARPSKTLGFGVGLHSHRGTARPSRRAPTLALSLAGLFVLSACAEVEPQTAEANPFEVTQVDPQPARRVAQVQIALRTRVQGPELTPAAQSVAPSPADLVKPGAALGLVKVSASKMSAERGKAKNATDSSSNRTTGDKSSGLPTGTALDVRGDFAEFRGVEERLVWAFAGASRPAWSELQIGDCMGVSTPAPRAPEPNTADTRATREIELLDLGRFEIVLGDQRFEVPLHLAPGILPYASGVQYRGEQVLKEQLAVRQADRQASPRAMALQWEGIGQQNLPGTRVDAPVPANLNFQLSRTSSDQGEQESTWYDIAWSHALRQEVRAPSRLYLHARLDKKAKSSATDTSVNEVVCRLEDRGEWQLDLEELADEGLEIRKDAGPLEFELRRVHNFERVVPGFDRVRVQIERSESLLLRQ